MRPVIRFACLSAAIALCSASSGAFAAKATECTKVGICYCVNDELKATIQTKVERFRQTIADQRKAGKAVGYLSVPLTSGGGGNFNVNKEVADSARAALEKRFGSEFVYVLNPATLEADLPKGTGADYMTELALGPAAAFSVLVVVIVFAMIALIGRVLSLFRAQGAPRVTSMLGG